MPKKYILGLLPWSEPKIQNIGVKHTRLLKTSTFVHPKALNLNFGHASEIVLFKIVLLKISQYKIAIK